MMQKSLCLYNASQYTFLFIFLYSYIIHNQKYSRSTWKTTTTTKEHGGKSKILTQKDTILRGNIRTTSEEHGANSRTKCLSGCVPNQAFSTSCMDDGNWSPAHLEGTSLNKGCSTWLGPFLMKYSVCSISQTLGTSDLLIFYVSIFFNSGRPHANVQSRIPHPCDWLFTAVLAF